ncbi:MAG: hypothetical protein VYC12_05770 [Candidatus Thermoplasmatota archaeon]|nr:hypothetical protein [Candidatus Thermoplasmatota archaeon]
MTGGTDQQNDVSSILVDKTIASIIHERLIEENLLDYRFKIKDIGNQVAIPIVNLEQLKQLNWFNDDSFVTEIVELEMKNTNQIPAQKIVSQISTFFKQNSIPITQEMLDNLPKKWEMFGDLAIIPNDSVNSLEWRRVLANDESLTEKIWQIIAECINVSRIARQAEIADDKIRSSQVKMIKGDSGEVEFLDNGVKFWLDVTKVMFSSGNVTERHRIGDIDMGGEVVVDAFAGIGYYTLPMLVRSNAKYVYACEINPNSIMALTRGAELNQVLDRLTIVEGDNQETLQSLTGIADRVHLGILPSSQNTWKLAIDCLKTTGGIIHIHMNVKESEIEEFCDYCVGELRQYAVNQCGFENVSLKHIEKVKWYAPHIRHIVLDVAIR